MLYMRGISLIVEQVFFFLTFCIQILRSVSKKIYYFFLDILKYVVGNAVHNAF